MTLIQKNIERAYQRAMNIRDSTSARVNDSIEYHYSRAYRQAYRRKDATGFASETRHYLKAVREAERADSFMHQLWLAEKLLTELGYEWGGENYILKPLPISYRGHYVCRCGVTSDSPLNGHTCWAKK